MNCSYNQLLNLPSQRDLMEYAACPAIASVLSYFVVTTLVSTISEICQKALITEKNPKSEDKINETAETHACWAGRFTLITGLLLSTLRTLDVLAYMSKMSDIMQSAPIGGITGLPSTFK